MKFWLFQNNQVNGPYDPEDLCQLPTYSPESLVCPEGRKGTSMGDWQRAGMVPELSVSLLKASAGAPAGKASGNRYDFPPEPTLKDLAALGSLQEKFSMLENSVSQLQEEMRRKDSALTELDKELDDKTKAVAELKTMLGGIEDRVAHITVLQGELDKAVAAEKEVEGNVEAHRVTLTRLNEQVEKLKADVSGIDQLKAGIQEMGTLKEEVQQEAGDIEKLKADVLEIDRLKSDRKGDADEIETLKAGIKDIESLRADLKELQAKQARSVLPEPESKKPPAIAAMEPFSPPPDSPPLGSPMESVLPSKPRPNIPVPSAVPLPFEFNPLAPPPSPGPKRSGFNDPAPGSPIPSAGAAETPKTAVADIVMGVVKEEAKPSRSRLPYVLAAGVLAASGIYFSGILKHRKRLPAPQADVQPLSPPTPQMEVKPPPVSPEVLEEQAKAGAVAMVKDWPAADGTKSLGQQLDLAFPSTGGLAPWMAEKKGDGVYQVNYYPPKSNANPKQTIYEFEARLLEKQVLPHNEAAQALMTGAKPAAPKKKKVRVKAKPAQAVEGDDLFKGMPGTEPEKTAEATKDEEAPAGSLMLPPAAPSKARKKKGKGPAAGKPADAELLDDLLKP